MSLREKMKPISRNKAMEILKERNITGKLSKKIEQLNESEFRVFLTRVNEAQPDSIIHVFFKRIPNLPDIINSEGGIFEIVQGNAIALKEGKFKESTVIFIKGWADNRRFRIYSKVNFQALSMYFHGRITLKELFLLRIDEPFILETKRGSTQGAKYTQDFVFYDDYLERSVLSTLQCGNEYYFQLPEGMRVENPTTGVLDILKSRF